MRKIREVLRLAWEEKRSMRDVAVSCRLARSTVASYLQKAKAAGLGWPLPELDDAQLEALLFPGEVSSSRSVVPDWHAADLELRRSKLVTRYVLWLEYREEHPEGLSYSRYCELLQEWRGLQLVSMRQTHVAGEKAFVDYAGTKIGITNRAYQFVCV